jgi:putative membrane protein
MSTSEFLLSVWEWRPLVTAACLGMVAAYAWAVRFRLTARAGAWVAAVLLLYLALVSPADTLADHYLFSIHMARHILFVLVVPALWLLGIPEQVVPAWVARFRVPPAMTWLAGIGAMALWHIPALFQAAMEYRAVHGVETLSLLICGTIYWWPILSPRPEARLQPVPQAAAYLFTSCLACTVMGIVITFTPRLVYANAHSSDPYGIWPLIHDGWNLSAAMDQQIGGLLMWVPGCLVYLTAIMAMFARWYAAEPETVEA